MSIIVVKVVPTFAEFYVSFDAELPLSTRFIVGVSDVIRAQLWLIVIAVAVGAFAFFNWIRRPGHDARFDGMLLKLPVVGR